MDSLVCEALNEICARGVAGVPIGDLWPRLQAPLSSSGLHLCGGVKQALWAGILRVPAVRAVVGGEQVGSGDASVQDVEEAERLGVRLVAASHLVDCSLGLYDIKYSGSEISAQQRRTLERLADSRTNGLTQSQLSKELEVKGNNFFYVVKSLESQGLLVRHSSLLRKKDLEAEEGTGMKCTSTNLMHLSRYAKHLNMNSQQKLEITQTELPVNMDNKDEGLCVQSDTIGNFYQNDVKIRDYMAAMRAVCDRLEESSDKALVVADIKAALGYRGGTKGHRAWRHVLKRLKEAGFVEEFPGKVGTKVLPCLRLKKKFSLTCTNEGPERVHPIKSGSRGEISDQLVELPLDNQVHDLIKAEGPKGLLFTEVVQKCIIKKKGNKVVAHFLFTFQQFLFALSNTLEVCERLGIQSKRNHTRLSHIFSKFGMHQQPESHNKTITYRLWTLENHPGGGKGSLGRGHLPSITSHNLVPYNDTFSENRSSPCNLKVKDVKLVAEGLPGEHFSNGHDKPLHMYENIDIYNHVRAQDLELAVVSEVGEFCTESAEIPLSAVKVSEKAPLYKRYQREQLTMTMMQRNQRILQRLQDEKFLLEVELLRWLTGLEKDKETKICRRTLCRHLSMLQKEGLCKRTVVEAPRVSNCWHNRWIRVVLHPSVESLSPLLDRAYERMRIFEKKIRDHSSHKSNNNECFPEVAGVEQISVRSSSEVQSYNEALKSSGFIPSKMVRARMLHNFFWSYLSGFPNWDEDEPACSRSISSRGSYKLFALDEAIRMMPLQLFLCVVGSALNDVSLFDKCRLGLRLSDLEKHDYQRLVETPAIRRLSLIIDILRRLKLIQLVSKEPDGVTDMVLTYALELNPYIEEPLSGLGQISDATSWDFQAKVRHDFVLSKKPAVDAYWKTLEYCYAATDPIAASHTFPGSAVKEVYRYRTWTSNQVISADQHEELLKHVPSESPSKRLPLAQCETIASELNLSLEQVLHFCCNKRRSNYSAVIKNLEGEKNSNRVTKLFSRKRKASTDTKLSKKVKVGSTIRERENTMPDERKSECDCRHTSVHSACDVNSEVGQDEGSFSFINRVTSYRHKVPRKERFLWTEDLDRKLVMQYARYRVTLGARFHRVDWESVLDLPAPPENCRRRMASLKSIPSVREAIMKLLNLLSIRYAKHLENTVSQPSSSSTTENSPLEVKSFCWDDFEAASVQKALNEVISCKQMAKDAQEKHITRHSVVKKVKSKSFHENSEDVLDGTSNPGHNFGAKQPNSLSIASAVELLKVVFLNSSMAPVVPDLLRMTLIEYPENDLLAAFEYLRKKNFLVEGQGSQPFALSKKFLHNTFSSPFPTNAGKKASDFASWLSNRDKELLEDRVILDDDLYCGEIFHLFALVSSGELLISPCLPSEGVGEAKEIRSVKRKLDSTQSSSYKTFKEPKSHYTSESDFSRREKGFPGISIAATRAFISRIEALQQSASDRIDSGKTCINMDFTSCIGDGRSLASAVNSTVNAVSQQWTNVANYAALRSSNYDGSNEGRSWSPVLFETVYNAIREAGPQGLQMEKIGDKSESVVEALEVFGLVIKINAFDSVHVVDASWKSKYCLRSIASHNQWDEVHSLKPTGRNNKNYDESECSSKKIRISPSETVMKLCDEHKITIVDSAGKDQHCFEATSYDDGSRENCIENEMVSLDGSSTSDNSSSFQPILPWLNGDGSLNNIVYRGLTRRVLGLVMQNPGILEEHLIYQMHVLNPQNCRKLLEVMVLDNHLAVKEIRQNNSIGPPRLLASLVRCNARSNTEVKLQKHYFANPMSTFFL